MGCFNAATVLITGATGGLDRGAVRAFVAERRASKQKLKHVARIR